MKNIVDYAQAEQRTFFEKEFCAVDSLILSAVSYWHFEGLVPGLMDSALPVSLLKLFIEHEEELVFNLNDALDKRKLLQALARLYFVKTTDDTVQKQFSAITCLLPDDTAYVAYRGTDATIVGWKEDFNMTYLCPIPSQQEGVAYLNAVGALIPNQLRLGGHSKGGNIAVYAAMFCDESVKNRILEIYNHDGPGFREEIIHSDHYKNIEEMIHITLPQSSLVGMLLYQKGEYAVVESNRFWISQHDPFSWEIEGDDFNYAERLTHSAVHLNETLDLWLSSYSDEKRALFIDTIYEVIKATNATTLSELRLDWRQTSIAALNAIRGIDAQTRKFIRQTIGALFFQSVKSIRKRDGKTEGQ